MGAMKIRKSVFCSLFSVPLLALSGCFYHDEEIVRSSSTFQVSSVDAGDPLVAYIIKNSTSGDEKSPAIEFVADKSTLETYRFSYDGAMSGANHFSYRAKRDADDWDGELSADFLWGSYQCAVVSGYLDTSKAFNNLEFAQQSFAGDGTFTGSEPVFSLSFSMSGLSASLLASAQAEIVAIYNRGIAYFNNRFRSANVPTFADAIGSTPRPQEYADLRLYHHVYQNGTKDGNGNYAYSQSGSKQDTVSSATLETQWTNYLTFNPYNGLFTLERKEYVTSSGTTLLYEAKGIFSAHGIKVGTFTGLFYFTDAYQANYSFSNIVWRENGAIDSASYSKQSTFPTSTFGDDELKTVAGMLMGVYNRANTYLHEIIPAPLDQIFLPNGSYIS